MKGNQSEVNEIVPVKKFTMKLFCIILNLEQR